MKKWILTKHSSYYYNNINNLKYILKEENLIKKVVFDKKYYNFI